MYNNNSYMKNSQEDTIRLLSENSNESTFEKNLNKDNSSEEEMVVISDEFEVFDEIYTSDNRLVYSYRDNCKLIINHDGENVTGILYYFDLGNSENAINILDSIKDEFSSMEVFSQIVQSNRYIKVLFDDSYASKFSLDEINSKYSNLEKVVRG